MKPNNQPTLTQLRSDLQFTIHQQGCDHWYSVHDPLNGQFFRLGVREYKLACLFREDLTAEELLEQIAVAEPPLFADKRPVTIAEVTQLATWLVRAGLCQTSQAVNAKSPYKSWILNPLSIRIPFISGPFLDRICAKISPLLSSRILLGMVVVYLAAIVCAISNWSTFTDATEQLFVSDSHLLWLAAWLILKVVHEAGHAIAAVRVGSNIRAAGLNIMFFAPIPYVDVSDLWTIANRWQRIACSAAGILAELFVASIATFVAINTESESLRYFCCAMAITGTVTTLAFNANPLMRFDGYFILSDLMNIPNLWTHSQSAANVLTKRIIFPWQHKKLAWPSLGYATYGASSLLYRWTLTLTMAATAVLVWDSVGVMLVLWGAYALYIAPWLTSYRKAAIARREVGVTSAWKERVWSTALLTTIGLAFMFAPSPIQPTAPGVVTFRDPVQVNAKSQGTLLELFVQFGSSIKEGDLIAVLEDPNLQVEFRLKQLEAQSVEESIRAQQAQGHLAELQSLEARLDSVRTQLYQLKQRVERLEIRAPQDGTVVALSVNNCLGKKISAGESICLLADPKELEAKVSASQQDHAAFRAAVGQTLSIRNVCLSDQLGTITKVSTRGDQYLTEPLLAGCYNGPIPVELDKSAASSQDQQWKLLAPRFDVHVHLKENSSYIPGQLIWVRVPGRSASVAQAIGTWIENRWELLKSQI